MVVVDLLEKVKDWPYKRDRNRLIVLVWWSFDFNAATGWRFSV